jgi:trimeric autotransporter adhesin
MHARMCTVLFLLCALLTACGGPASNGGGKSLQGGGTSGSSKGGSGSVTISSIQISPNLIAIAPGATQQFSATADMSDGSTQDVTSSVQWVSSDPSVATIDTAGRATGNMPGVATITATSGSVKASATLTITSGAANLSSIVITPANPTLPVNTAQQLTATGNYSDGSSADITGMVTWSSNSNSIAVVSTSGLLTGNAAGTTTISATLGTLSGTTQVTVSAPTVASIAVTPVGLTLAIGINQQYVATATYSDGSSADLTSGVTWSSSDTNTATINSSGLATTVAAGQVTITATLGALSDQSTLTIVAAHLSSISVTPSVVSISAGTTQQFTATGSFDDGSTQLLQNVTWSSSSNSATMSSSGLATGVSTGTATITATSGSVSGTASLTVTGASLVSIAVTPANSTMAPDTIKQFTATGTFSDSSTQDISGLVVWTSSSPAHATISSQGLATGLAAGTTTITAIYGTISGSTGLTVSNVSLVSITVSPANPRINAGTLIKFTATGTFSDGSVATNLSGVSWKSQHPNLASIRGSGIAHGKKGGSVTITASAFGVSGTTTLTVGTGTLVSIVVTPANPSAAAGGTQQFTATGTFSDSSTQDITLNSHWSSSSSSVATIANAPSVAGLANCKAPGSTNITANSGGITGSTGLTVQ